ncbi:uncharacterized protein LOC127636023 isoform X2 [Xyrauchen texanus]|uniref:uncharacterized protein LOC127636023 isoform X2 n=1 Tax=Xyrauchen texanus TaxID=154827 RepID=UPI002241E6AC|nr:uncharacterized protein LOC127636023 isoform X2 [Xyrauchen texanus]
MEVTDNPPDAVNESTVTLGLQSSPSMVDAATQTDVNQSDAAVQWPADVDYPVKKDHSYTGKHEIEMGKRVQEDDIDNSQDLFLSNDELGEQSQPQCSHFDPEYIAVFQDGESVGEPKFKISWSKVHKTFRARPVPVEKDYSYMTAMTADVLSSVLDSKQVMDMRINPTHVMAPQERLSRSQIIFKHSSFHVSSSCIITNT